MNANTLNPTVNTQQPLANSSFTIQCPRYTISVDDLAECYASAYHRAYATQDPDVIEEFYLELDGIARSGYDAGGKLDKVYQAYYDAFMGENGKNISQQSEAIKQLSYALASMTLCGVEYHRHTNIWLYRIYVGLLEAILTDPARAYLPEQVNLHLFLQDLNDCAA